MSAKKMISIVTCTCLVFAGTIIAPAEAQAKSPSARVWLKEGKTYDYDLDGDGKNEQLSISVKHQEEAGDINTFLTISVNGSPLVTTDKITNSLGAEAYLADFNTNDPHKDIFVTVTTDSECISRAYDYQYSNGAMQKILDADDKYFAKYDSPRIFLTSKQPGNGEIGISLEGMHSTLGQFSYEAVFSVSDGKLTKKDQSLYQMRNQTYTTKVPLSVSAKRNGKEAFEIPEGAKFTANKVYMSGNKATHIYVKYKDKKGWLTIPKKQFLSDYESHLAG